MHTFELRLEAEFKIARMLNGQKARKSSINFGQGDLVKIGATHIDHPTSTPVVV